MGKTSEHMSMQALWLENQQLQLKTDLPMPEVPAGEALVRVLRAGICNTDLELVRGYYPYRGIPGRQHPRLKRGGYAQSAGFAHVPLLQVADQPKP